MELQVERRFGAYREEITLLLRDFFGEQARALSRFSMDAGIFEKLGEFTTRGKMYRGGIILYVYELFNPDADRIRAVRAAAALELLEAGILIQDDVMDRDEMRRGEPAVWAHFRDTTGDIKKTDAASFGRNVAVCVGDIAYFLSFTILNGLAIPEDMKRSIFDAYAGEMSALSLSQVQDLFLASVKRDVTEEETIDMYAAKTARYSWVLPFETALILAGHGELSTQFAKIGNFAGLVYQLVDDQIGLFGDEKKTGKTAGGDVREGKKTLYWHYARKLLQPGDLKRFDGLYGRRDISVKDLDAVRELVRSSGAYEKVEALTETYLQKADSEISRLNLTDDTKERLREMISFISRRKI